MQMLVPRAAGRRGERYSRSATGARRGGMVTSMCAARLRRLVHGGRAVDASEVEGQAELLTVSARGNAIGARDNTIDVP